MSNEDKPKPDDLGQIHHNRLAYFSYSVNPLNSTKQSHSLEDLVNKEVLGIQPVTYEDFLPVSAAGIFQSNLDNLETQDFTSSPNQQAFEKDLGCQVINEFDYYAKIQTDSLKVCFDQLGFDSDKQENLLAELN